MPLILSHWAMFHNGFFLFFILSSQADSSTQSGSLFHYISNMQVTFNCLFKTYRKHSAINYDLK